MSARRNGRRSISARTARTTAEALGGPVRVLARHAAVERPAYLSDLRLRRASAEEIIGGYASIAGQAEGLQGQYFFGDEVAAGKIFTLHFDGTSWVATERTAQITTDVGSIDAPSSFGRGRAPAISTWSISTARCSGSRRRSRQRIRATSSSAAAATT